MNPWTRAVASAAAATFVVAGSLMAATAPASADPVTSSATAGGVTVDVHYADTEIEPGGTLSLTADFTFNGDETSADYIAVAPEPWLVPGDCEVTSAAGECTVNGEGTAVLVSALAEPAVSVSVNVPVIEDASGMFELFQGLGVPGSDGSRDFSPPVTISVVEPVPEADLSAGLSAVSAGLLASAIDYTATATNAGPDTAENVQIVVSLPAATSTVSNLPAGCVPGWAADMVTCNVGNVASGGSASRTFRASLGLLSLGPLNASSTVSSTTDDPVATNNTATKTCTVLTALIISC